MMSKKYVQLGTLIIMAIVMSFSVIFAFLQRGYAVEAELRAEEQQSFAVANMKKAEENKMKVSLLAKEVQTVVSEASLASEKAEELQKLLDACKDR